MWFAAYQKRATAVCGALPAQRIRDGRAICVARLGWRPMFWLEVLPAFLALYIRTKVPESEAWKQPRAASMRQVLYFMAQNWR